jgi:hypothetical protein
VHDACTIFFYRKVGNFIEKGFRKQYGIQKTGGRKDTQKDRETSKEDNIQNRKTSKDHKDRGRDGRAGGNAKTPQRSRGKAVPGKSRDSGNKS